MRTIDGRRSVSPSCSKQQDSDRKILSGSLIVRDNIVKYLTEVRDLKYETKS